MLWLQVYDITPVGSVNYGAEIRRTKITNLQDTFGMWLLQVSRKSALLSGFFTSISIPHLQNGVLNPESAGLKESLLEQGVQNRRLKII